jgi:hypothetical protein
LTASYLKRIIGKTLTLFDNLLLRLIAYYYLFKFNSIGKGIAATTLLGLNTVGVEKG